MGMVMIFLRMRGPGACNTLREPARIVAGRRGYLSARAQSGLKNPILPQEKVNLGRPSTPGVLRRVGDAPDGSAAIPPGFRPAPARAARS